VAADFTPAPAPNQTTWRVITGTIHSSGHVRAGGSVPGPGSVPPHRGGGDPRKRPGQSRLDQGQRPTGTFTLGTQLSWDQTRGARLQPHGGTLNWAAPFHHPRPSARCRASNSAHRCHHGRWGHSATGPAWRGRRPRRGFVETGPAGRQITGGTGDDGRRRDVLVSVGAASTGAARALGCAWPATWT